MPAKKNPKAGRNIVARARQVLEFAEQLADKKADWLELSNALFAPNGKATLAFATEAERAAFSRTEEYKQILALMDRLPAPPSRKSSILRPPPTVPSAYACPAPSMRLSWPKRRRRALA